MHINFNNVLVVDGLNLAQSTKCPFTQSEYKCCVNENIDENVVKFSIFIYSGLGYLTDNR